MAKRKLVWSEEKIEKRKEQGYGKGEGKNYKPWILTYDFPSKGIAKRITLSKTGRTHHVMSDLESSYLYLLEWAEDVIDIMEQYPLFDVERCQEIAESLGYKYPKYPGTAIPYIMTSDFVIRKRTAEGSTLIARTLKPSEKLEQADVLKKFQIEKEYWNSYQTDWGIVTENDIPKQFVTNVKNYICNLDLEPFIKSKESQEYLKCQMLRELDMTKDMQEFFSNFDYIHKLSTGTGIAIFKHLVAIRCISIKDMNKPIIGSWDFNNVVKCINSINKGAILNGTYGK